MSFILQFFHAPQVDSVESAVAYVDSGCAGDPPPVERFQQFVERVSIVYPDLSEEDEDCDNEKNLWPEGLDSRWVDEPVVNIAFKTDAAEDGVLSIIATKAIEAGLQMFDPQNAMLYRADHLVVEANGKATPFRMLTPFAARLQTLYGGLKVPEVRNEIGERLRNRLAAAGDFSLSYVDRPPVVYRVAVYRQLGDMHQAIAIEAAGAGSNIEVTTELWLASEKLSSVWLNALPPRFAKWKAAGDEYCGGTAFDFVFGLPDIVPAASAAEIAGCEKTALRSAEALEDYIARLCAFVSDKLLPVLDKIDGLEPLAAIAFTEQGIRAVSRGFVRLPEQMGTAVLARLTRPAQFEEIAAALRSNPHKAEYWREFDDPEGRYLDQLIEHLRTMPV